MLRRLHSEQPDSFTFTSANQKWAEAQITKYPKGRQASAVIPLLWRAQEQEGWLTRPAIEAVAEMLGMAPIRVLEVASFYFMFQLQPVGSVAHVQVCGTLSCMICGAEDLIAVCREKIAEAPHTISSDGKFSWEEVECLGACTNAPMVQIGKDFYEDLTVESFASILDALAAGNVPVPGPQNGRYAAEPLSGLTSLKQNESGRTQYNASVQAAVTLGDTVKRIDGTEVPILTPWVRKGGTTSQKSSASKMADAARPMAKAAAQAAAKVAARVADVVKPADKRSDESVAAAKAETAKVEDAKQSKSSVEKSKAPKKSTPKTKAPQAKAPKPKSSKEVAPATLDAPKGGAADDLKRISGVGPKLEGLLNSMGFWHFDQIATWKKSEIAWVDSRLKFKGRIERDDWVAQAKKLAKEAK